MSCNQNSSVSEALEFYADDRSEPQSRLSLAVQSLKQSARLSTKIYHSRKKEGNMFPLNFIPKKHLGIPQNKKIFPKILQNKLYIGYILLVFKIIKKTFTFFLSNTVPPATLLFLSYGLLK